MPAGVRRSVRWFAAAAAGAIAGAILLGVALRGGSAPEGPPAGAGPEAGAPDAVDAGIGALATTSEAADATRLVASARAEAASGHLAQARGLLARASAADPGPGALLELATLEFQIGDCRNARRAAQRVVAAASGGPLADQAKGLLGKIGRCD